MNAAAVPSSFPRWAAGLLLTALLVLLAFRLTASESLRETLAQKTAALAQEAAPKTADSTDLVPIVGPVFTAFYAAITWLLAGAATLLAARYGALSLWRLGQLGLMLAILGLALGSTFHAANRFNALIGTVDLAASLGAAWIVLLVCHERLLGDRGRQAIIAALVAILMLGVAKGLMQYFWEFPDTLQMVQKNPDQELRKNGIDPEDFTQKTLFMARLKSAEVSGYTMSNVFATQMIAYVALLAGLAVAGLVMLKPPPAPQGKSRGRHALEPARSGGGDGGVQIPLHVLALGAVGLLLLVGLAILPLTDSKGGCAAAALAVGAVVVGGFLRKQVERRRKLLLAALALAAVLLPAAVLGYGLTHHGLPSKSLLFRWQYWTGAAPMIQGHPVWGVGFNNFGDYYLRFKLPSAPEDVKDPHSFFVRLAAEMGLPGTLAIGALLLWLLHGALRRRVVTDASTGSADVSKLDVGNPGLGQALKFAALGAAAWVPLHFLAETPVEYNVIVTLLLAVTTWAVFAAVLALFAALRAEATRYIVLAGVVAALAMLLYDQINMALVTGPVAMLFWILLALGAAQDTKPGQFKIKNQKSKIIPPLLASLPPFAAGLAALAALALPLAGGSWPADPATHEYMYIKHKNAGDVEKNPQMKAGAYAQALDSLDAAIARAPNSIELRLERVTLRREALHLPVAGEIRQILTLGRASAGLRLMLALPETDLPAAERSALLEEALALDAQLPADEVKRLTPERIREINEAVVRLKQQPP